MLYWEDAESSQKFSAWINVDGQDAVEYDVQTSKEDKTVTCWIASELGKKFVVKWTIPALPHVVNGRIRIDGKNCQGSLCSPNGQEMTRTKAGITDGTVIKPFVFSTLELTDDDALLGSSTSSLAELGVIQLTLIPSEILGSGNGATYSSFQISDDKVHERTKKAVTQRIKLADAEVLRKPITFSTYRRIGPDIVTFCFKYRPMDVLRANGIAPPLPTLKRKASAEPSPSPVEDRDDAEELADLEEARVLREKLRALEERLAKRDTKPRITSSKTSADVIDLTQDRSKRKRIKAEPGKSTVIPGEVIDLT
ncbi:hypothetical protein R3P38DRAFT_3326413 [Favolaschia claudopus]|uniref:DUF7918 domain-containing protein n=1 Tax=Favolaschia claudopus TaxID=2862362 RepID=A0AAW0ABE0_9AGAR